MFNIQDIRVDDSEDYISSFLDNNCGETLGSGAFACVYESSEKDRVIKVTNEDDYGYIAYLRQLSMLKKQNSFAPKIFWAERVADRSTYQYIISMEKLITSYEYVGESKKEQIKFESCRQIINNVLRGDPIHNFSSDCDIPAKKLKKYQLPKEFKDFVPVLKKAKRDSGRMSFDLHDGNFMFRPNGNLVITDPLGY